MWREALRVWKLSLLRNPIPVGFLFLLIAFLSLLTPLPGIGFLNTLLNTYLIFSYVVYVSKAYIASGGDSKAFLSSLGWNPTKVFFRFFRETLAIITGQLILTLGAGALSLLVFSLGGVWSVLKPLLEGGEVSWLGLVLSLILSLFLYFSVVSSFPIFFGRAMQRGRGFWGTLKTFLSSIYAEVSWRTLLNWDYIKSSFIMSVITLLLLLAHLLFILLPLFIPLLSFLTIHLIYTFGTVAVFRLLRS